MYTYVLTVDLLSSGVQVARHGHHRICSPDRPRVDMWRRTTGELRGIRARGSRAFTSNLRIYSWSRAGLEPRAEQQLVGTADRRDGTFDARALSMARMSS